MTMDRRFFTPFIVVLTAAAASGCRDAPLAVNVDSNMAPSANAGPMQTFDDYAGSPVPVKLEGSGSDPDGTIASYRWLSATRPEGGSGRIGPDPDDVASPTVELDKGTWLFTLWVTDNEGAISLPSTVMIKVGKDVTMGQQECSDNSLQVISQDCRLCLCSVDNMCEMLAPVCDQACWDFYGCTINNCGDVLADEAALTDCVRMYCPPFYAGVGKYQMIKSCIDPAPCAEPCQASAKSMGM
jgi:hypothetical protein